MRFIEQDHVLRPGLAKITLEHDKRIEDMILVANNDVHPVGDIRDNSKGQTWGFRATIEMLSL